MALHFYSCIFSSKPRIVATKAQHSEYFNPAKVDSLHIANKWNIVQERSSAQVYKTGNLSMNLSEKVEVVRNEFWKSVDEKSLKDLYMIDVMQRLNIDYHFKEEIEALLGKQYVNCSNIIGSGYGTTLHFYSGY
ncbi:hypothetical protein PHAVU_002G219200 [Phaseolus vulgaris]|uniref:Terpene synthase N-terminal domain-containing protein n=1 Tax=Phaseolus vulgaris TaxID=3885 RepID=V7CPF1_PHAVU|nr:hypothetical protein PHAVU_002G219200g [Phaseolus vulgaris]ESW31213.1 hypothetical protein PHAVU_002G219200g [Phaseolus vulgaris]